MNNKAQCQATECGVTKDGLHVLAVTDIAGSQVIVEDRQNPDGTHLLSQPLMNHEACISLGHQVRECGIDCYSEWRSPIGLFEFACLCAVSTTGEKME